MGEAKRRRLAGSYPEQISAAHWRVPAGMIAITLDVSGCDPSTLAFEASVLVDWMEQAGTQLRASPYATLVRSIARDFPRFRGRDEARCHALGLAALWSALNHPTAGEGMRMRVSAALRRDGKAHISWCVGPNGLAMALSECFVDLDGLAAAHAATGAGVTVLAQQTDNTEVMQ